MNFSAITIKPQDQSTRIATQSLDLGSRERIASACTSSLSITTSPATLRSGTILIFSNIVPLPSFVIATSAATWRSYEPEPVNRFSQTFLNIFVSIHAYRVFSPVCPFTTAMGPQGKIRRDVFRVGCPRSYSCSSRRRHIKLPAVKRPYSLRRDTKRFASPRTGSSKFIPPTFNTS
ncbi:hypothetical protein STSP2_00954 [Anaerohalosphaera lusitana]|uniref:Uncharacterized protein n=1 Tax=Anaerohalosphaera lusitana TaxID=1936003 RepID=A0A1U9NJ97_9BACT|nr:hypothetical protein STSP2_00954 [Anaerohalosphaera lusitana]